MAERKEGNPVVCVCLGGLVVFFGVGLLLTLAVTAFAYSQRDPSAYLFLGRVCPYLAAVVAGGAGGRLLRERSWIVGGVIGLLSSAFLWLLSAGLARETSEGASLLMYLGVAVVAALGGALFGRENSSRRRRLGRHRRK